MRTFWITLAASIAAGLVVVLVQYGLEGRRDRSRQRPAPGSPPAPPLDAAE
jgi:hypothetical protein